MKITTEDFGNRVICDACGDDYTNREDKGGFLFGSKAYCPGCAVRSLPDITAYGEQRYIRATCPPEMSFREWVLKLRDGNNTVTMISF